MYEGAKAPHQHTRSMPSLSGSVQQVLVAVIARGTPGIFYERHLLASLVRRVTHRGLAWNEACASPSLLVYARV